MVVDDSLPDLVPLNPVRGELRVQEFPPVLQRAGVTACFAADEFFSARISNPETRRAYGRAVGWFLEFCEREDVELAHVTPGLAGRFLRDLPVSAATKNQALAALRHFFDALVTRHAVVLNPFHSVRGIQHQVIDGKTPEISLSQARRLFAAIELDSPMGLRDRAMLGTPSSPPAAASGRFAGCGSGTCATTRKGGCFAFARKTARNGRSRCATTWTSGSGRICKRPGSPKIPPKRRCGAARSEADTSPAGRSTKPLSGPCSSAASPRPGSPTT